MQVSLLASAAGLWMAVRTAPALAGVGALLATMVQMGVLGALITFSSRALYAPHLLGPQDWGSSPLADQPLAGPIMRAPAAASYFEGSRLLLGLWRRPQPAPPPPRR